MSEHKDRKVIDFFSGKAYSDIAQQRIIRIAPENDGLTMLYSNDNNPDKYFAMKILFWGLRQNGDVVALVPWLDKIVACPDIQDPLNGCWEGYYDSDIDHIFYDAPMHKLVELETAFAYFETELDEHQGEPSTMIQEMPDTIGTHALLTTDDKSKLTLTEIISWRLYADGHLDAMLIDPEKVSQTPVLSGDPCLYPASSNANFRYYFQYPIANEIKNQNPEALDAIAVLLAHEHGDSSEPSD